MFQKLFRDDSDSFNGKWTIDDGCGLHYMVILLGEDQILTWAIQLPYLCSSSHFQRVHDVVRPVKHNEQSDATLASSLLSRRQTKDTREDNCSLLLH